ncbi:Uncharacterised protein [Bacillus pumilus]|nr:Uncharacterised protein [Bacillus pumilus]
MLITKTLSSPTFKFQVLMGIVLVTLIELLNNIILLYYPKGIK